MAFPASYEDCKPYLEECIQRLERGPDRVLIVNGLKQYEEMSPDFDRDDVWKILVGGTKLSRGYTVEGLTVSYYRRASTAADTLMQMGRWFGFRQGYTDLMRLFIGRAEGSKSLDLYLAFEAICRDEIDFRQELLKYAKPSDGSEPLTPMQVPPLVSQHMREMPPAAGNKRFNAVIQSENFGGKPVASTLAPRKKVDVKTNQRITRDLMDTARVKACVLGLTDEPFSALTGTVSPASMLEFMAEYRWSKEGILYRPINFLKGQLGDPEIDQWSVIWPLLSGERKLGSWSINEKEDVSVVYRYRNDNDRFLAYTTPQHVRAAKAIALGENLGNVTPQTREYALPRTGVALFYAVKGKEDSGEYDEEVSIGFYLLAPRNSIKEKIKWGVIMKDQQNSPIIEIGESTN